MKNVGFKVVIFIVKYVDGFCLWFLVYINYFVKSFLWKNGIGDVVCEVLDVVREEGFEFGLYMLFWDCYEFIYGDIFFYNDYYFG